MSKLFHARSLSHVLVPESCERDPHFYFPDKHRHQGIVDFATIPFVRMYGLLPPLLKREQTYSQRVKLSQIYLEDISSQTGQITLNLQKQSLSIGHYELLHFQPLNAGLYLFLFEQANRARGQAPFYFKDAFQYRNKLITCLTRAGATHNDAGLSSLIGLAECEWFEYWKNLGQRDQIEARKNDLENAFGKLHQDLKGIWPNASFQVFKGKRGDAKGPCRWIEIDPDRMQLVELKVLLIR